MAEKILVPCYNCNGTNTIQSVSSTSYVFKNQEGGPVRTCMLCKAHGDGKGMMYHEYRNKKVEVGGLMFHPPHYSCVYCKDRHIVQDDRGEPHKCDKCDTYIVIKDH